VGPSVEVAFVLSRDEFLDDATVEGTHVRYITVPYAPAFALQLARPLTEVDKSLERIRALRPRVIYPTHGPPFHEPDAALDAYIRHRETRLQAVRSALGEGPSDAGRLVSRVYGAELAPQLRPAATAAITAYLEYLAVLGDAGRAADGRWRPTPTEPGAPETRPSC
jgi:glyoxylase-like metal-dependent hydrolase (beta-lactamase superfamily II)